MARMLQSLFRPASTDPYSKCPCTAHLSVPSPPPPPPPPQAERYVCSVPRGRYSLLGHRAALALAHEPEGGDSFAAFLRSTLKEEEVGALFEMLQYKVRRRAEVGREVRGWCAFCLFALAQHAEGRGGELAIDWGRGATEDFRCKGVLLDQRACNCLTVNGVFQTWRVLCRL
jgi:hypothetical protein